MTIFISVIVHQGIKSQEQRSCAWRVLLHCLRASSVAGEKCDNSLFLFLWRSSALSVKKYLEFLSSKLSILINMAAVDFFLSLVYDTLKALLI